MNTPTLNVPLDKISKPAEKLAQATVEAGKATAERITKKSAKEAARKKHRRTRFLLTRGPLLAGAGWLLRWLTDPVSGPARREMIKSKAMGVVGRSSEGQVRGEGSMAFDRTPEPAHTPPATLPPTDL